MSGWILDPTTLPGFKRLHRQPLQRTIVQSIDSGKEARVQKYLTQRWRYEPEFELLRSSATFLELQKILGFFTRHAGKRDNFLLLDPEDNAVTDHGFGVGDGTTTSFQLQRTLGAGTLTQDVLGSWDTYTKPRTNLALWSQDFSNAAWSKTNITVSGGFIAPDGSLGTSLNDGVATGQHYIFESLSETNGQVRTYAVFAKAGTGRYCSFGVGTSGQRIDVDLQTGSFAVVGANVTGSVTFVGNGWWQLSMTYISGGTGNGMILMMQQSYQGPTSYTGTNLSINAWGAQAEVAAGATRYIPTTSAAVRVDPLYWPAQGDGFEPVVDPLWRSVSLTVGGVGYGNWSPGANGLVTLNTPPAAGVALAWTGSFYRRVRIDDDEPRFEQIMPGRFRGPFEMVSVI